MKTGTIINLIFDANRGNVAQLSREGVVGEPYGALPTPTRRGYTFVGWYYKDVLVTPDAIIETDEDIRLIARWEKAAPEINKRHSMLKRQKIAIIALSAVAVALIITFVIVAQLISIYTFVDTYTIDGVEYNDKYIVKRHDGVYKLFDADGNLMKTNGSVLGNIFIAEGSGNQYRIDAETGAHTLRATVDAEDGEYSSGTILLMFPQILSADMYSITMKNGLRNDQSGEYTIYRTKDGVKIKDFEKSNLEFDQDLFAQLCFSCGYMVANRKMGANSTDPLIPRLPDGTIDYSVYGLDTPQAIYTISGLLYKKNADGSVMYKNGKAVVDYDEEGNPKQDPEKTYTVHVGDAILSGAGYYVRLEGRGSVYIVTTDYIESTLLQPIEKLVVPRVVFPVSVTYHSMGKDFSLNYLPTWTENNWKDKIEEIVSFSYSELEERINTMNSTRPYLTDMELMEGYNINENSAISVFENFYSIEALSCRRIGLTAETMAKFNLDKNVYYLTYATFSGNYDENGEKLYAVNELFISQKTPQGTYYVAAVPFDMIVEVDQYYFSFLEWDYMKWYNEVFIFHNVAYVRDITFTFNGEAFGLDSDKTYEFSLDNSLSYAYYINEKGSFSVVNLSEGKVYIENGKKFYKKGSKTYNIVAEVNLDEATVVGNKDVILDPTLTDVVYVEENFYYTNEKGESVTVSPDYVTTTIEYVVERDKNDKIIGGSYFYVDLLKNERIRVSRSIGDPIYRFDYKKKTYEVTLGVSASGLLVSCNGELLEYNISNSGMGDAGVEEYETITATDNFRKLHMELLYFSLMGDVDPVEFKNTMGMSVEEYLASDDKQPMATIFAHVEDYARALNGYTYHDKDGKEVRVYDENNSQYLAYKFYQYTDWKVLVTIEAYEMDENGELVPLVPDENGEPVVVGKFYASTSILNKLVSDIDRLLNAEVIDNTTKH